MPLDAIHQSPGDVIRRLREERHLRPGDIQRISEQVKRRRNCADFAIGHATLNDIEKRHSIPNVREMFTLAVCLRLPLEEILKAYGAASDDVMSLLIEGGSEPAVIQPGDTPVVPQSETAMDLRRTSPVFIDTAESLLSLGSMAASRTTRAYSWIGTEDDTMGDLIPGGSIVEIDRTECTIEVLEWSNFRERPVFFCWTKDGYRCCWCERDGVELVVMPHPTSGFQPKRYRQPREAHVMGRVVHAWISFGHSSASAMRASSG